MPVGQTDRFKSVIDWSGSLDGSVTRPAHLFTSPYKVAVNRGSLETPRCPSWNLCEGSTQTGSHDGYAAAYDSAGNALANAVGFAYQTKLPCNGSSVNGICEGFLCGEPIALRSLDGAVGDWWVCAGDACRSSGDNWQLACPRQTECTLTMADTNLVVVRTPVDRRSALQADPNSLPRTYSKNL